MLAFALLLAAAAPAPVQTLPATAMIAMQTAADCQAQIDSLVTAVGSAKFSGKNAEKERTGLVGKLNGAKTALTAGKYADTLKKLEDFRLKVVELKAAQKIDGTDADALLAGVNSAKQCVEGVAATAG